MIKFSSTENHDPKSILFGIINEEIGIVIESLCQDCPNSQQLRVTSCMGYKAKLTPTTHPWAAFPITAQHTWAALFPTQPCGQVHWHTPVELHSFGCSQQPMPLRRLNYKHPDTQEKNRWGEGGRCWMNLGALGSFATARVELILITHCNFDALNLNVV